MGKSPHEPRNVVDRSEHQNLNRWLFRSMAVVIIVLAGVAYWPFIVQLGKQGQVWFTQLLEHSAKKQAKSPTQNREKLSQPRTQKSKPSLNERRTPRPKPPPLPRAPQQKALPGWHILPKRPNNKSVNIFVVRHWQVRGYQIGASQRMVKLTLKHQRCRLDADQYPKHHGGRVYYGQLSLGGRSHCVAITGLGTKEKPWLWWDLNGDGRFNDPGAIFSAKKAGQLAVRVVTEMPDPQLRMAHPLNQKYTFWAWVRDTKAGVMLYYYPTTEITAVTELPGMPHPVALVVSEQRGQRDGDFTDDGVFIDLDGDGTFSRHEYLAPNAVLVSPEGMAWRIRVKP
ncbi:MAG: hypothetical protein D6706_21785 [Chloroflexi bacterium]|nr:MAG: hypothetical protein D6706_21785 [Chloroflexota bacterium]